jgi:hypothetical protein
MRSSTIVLAIGLLASPLALLANPAGAPMTNSLTDLVQYTPAPPDQTIHGRPLTDAPVSNLPPLGVAPVDRAAGPGSRDLSAGPVNATPFSAAPTSNLAAGSPATPNGTAAGVATPSLGK